MYRLVNSNVSNKDQNPTFASRQKRKITSLCENACAMLTTTVLFATPTFVTITIIII